MLKCGWWLGPEVFLSQLPNAVQLGNFYHIPCFIFFVALTSISDSPRLYEPLQTRT